MRGVQERHQANKERRQNKITRDVSHTRESNARFNITSERDQREWIIITTVARK